MFPGVTSQKMLVPEFLSEGLLFLFIWLFGFLFFEGLLFSEHTLRHPASLGCLPLLV